jgi:hypothetical protein
MRSSVYAAEILFDLQGLGISIHWGQCEIKTHKRDLSLVARCSRRSRLFFTLTVISFVTLLLNCATSEIFVRIAIARGMSKTFPGWWRLPLYHVIVSCDRNQNREMHSTRSISPYPIPKALRDSLQTCKHRVCLW